MPNWVLNKVCFAGNKNKIKEIKDYLKTEELEFDFNKILPMPEELNVPASSDENIARACYKAKLAGEVTVKELTEYDLQRMSFDEWAALGKKYENNVKKYGASNWYDWCIENWGTKWNACNAEWYGDEYIDFDTAWSCPEGIYRKLAQMYPDVTIEASFADEDIGNNCGTVLCENGECEINYVDTIEFACGVWDYDYEDYMSEYGEENGTET